MSTQSNAVPDTPLESQATVPAMMKATQPFYWSVRRELWENRTIYIAPLAVAGLFLLGFLLNLAKTTHRIAASLQQSEMQQHQLIEQPYHFSEILIMGATFLVAIFYCLDALYGERRDRSILFWKSLPVSDLTTVLSKASIPVVLIPLLTFAVTVVTQAIILALSTMGLAMSGLSASPMLKHLSLFHLWMGLLYHLIAIHGLWYAPFWAWFLMVSAWAKRSPFLWAFLVPFAIGVLEKITFNTSHFANMLLHRFMGGPGGAASSPGSMSMDTLTPFTLGQFLTSPGLWVGLGITAVFLAVAVRLRQYRDPI
jgi:ABC-2 type transport system permease protein